MKYERPHYLTPGIRVEKRKLPFRNDVGEVPIPDFPISPIENLRLAAAAKLLSGFRPPYRYPDLCNKGTAFRRAKRSR
jgi:hypothetical protein